MKSASTNPKRSPREVAHRASSALLRRRVIDTLGRWMTWTLLASVILIVGSKLSGWGLGDRWWWGWIVLAGVGALAASLVSAMRTRLSDAQGGGLLDARLGLKSQIRSAIELSEDQSNKEHAPGFVALAQAQGERAAAGIEINAAMPAINTNNWWRALGVLALAIGLGVWMPMRGDGRATNPRLVPDQAIASIASVKATIADEPSVESPSVQEALDDLQSLEDELGEGVEDSAQANAQTAAKLEELAKALDDESERSQAQASELADQIAEAQNRQDQAWDQRLSDFADAIKEQDYDQAQQDLGKLREQADQMSDAQREQLGDELEQLADAVEPDSLEDEPPQAQPDDELSDSLRDEAEDLRSPPEPTKEPESVPEPEPQQDESTPPDEPESSKDQGKSAEQGEKQSTPQSGDQDQPQSGSESDQRKAQEQDGSSEDQSGDESGDESPKQSDTDQQHDQQSKPSDQPSTDDEGATPKASPSQNTSEQDQQQSREQQQDQQTGDQQNQDQQSDQQSKRQSKPTEQADKNESDQQGTQQRKGRSLDKALEKMKERQTQARRDQNQAEKIRQQARKLIDPDQPPKPNEEQSSGVRRDERAQDNQGTGGDEPRDEHEHPISDGADTNEIFVPVDASGKGPSDDAKPVGKWYAPDGEAGDTPGASETAQRFKEASRKAQRAVDQQQVPRKYRRVVREVFKRVKQRGDAIESGSKIAPQGKDATPKKGSKSAPTKAGDDQ